MSLPTEQLHPLMIGLPWHRIGEGSTIRFSLGQYTPTRRGWKPTAHAANIVIATTSRTVESLTMTCARLLCPKALYSISSTGRGPIARF